MQVISKNEDERTNSKGTSSIDSLIYIGRVSGYVEGEYTGRFGDRRSRIRISWGIFSRIKERVWGRRRISESSRIKKVGARRENDRGVCT